MNTKESEKRLSALKKKFSFCVLCIDIELYNNQPYIVLLSSIGIII